MKFEPVLYPATLIKRYKRFLADIELPNGDITTIHCPNTGAMTGCAESGFKVWFSLSDNPKRKYPGTFELAQNNHGHLIGINTGRANHLVVEAIQNDVITELAGYQFCKTEVKYGKENSRIDVYLSDDNKPDCYVEIKSTTLLIDDCGYFPDSVTTRGQKHIRELMSLISEGKRAVLFFCVQHTGINEVKVADFIDKKYASLLNEAIDVGVEVICYGCKINENSIEIDHKLNFISN
ncbi:DNA/RNA nuclease SfsA [Thalassotalea psychrophila]|uniref:Sugar fermentation stimulation protein homolog n=1 Tax=Thalassotalea psychrophila TaxID=3065647 RepID=A0ABY9TVC0_9GAMM|nr:DNA/RNA nuclease SfsA [Colwelliaceae bacterium SQ149]